MYMSDVNSNDYWTAAGEVATLAISILVVAIVYSRTPVSSGFLKVGAASVSFAVTFAVLYAIIHKGYSVDGEGEES